MHVILVWTCTGSSLGGLTTLTGGHSMLSMYRPGYSGDFALGMALAAKVLSYPSDEYIRWYRGITRVYIGNLANRDTRSHGYQLAGVDKRMMEVDDMASMVIQEPPIDPSQMAVFAKKVLTIIRRCMVSIGGTLSYTLSQHDIQQTFPVQPLRRRPREHPGRGAGSGRPPVPSFLDGHEHVDPGHAEDLPHVNHHILHLSGFSCFVHPLLLAQPVHLHRISLYRRHLHLMKRSGRMTWMVYSIIDSGIVLQQNIPIPHDTNTTTLPEHIISVTHMVSDEPSMLYSTVNNDDDEVDGSNRDDAVSSQSESDDDNDSEEGEFQTPRTL
ncbi:hypothetical protein M9H77_36608 [Catharanthus roseus]|uniref:Uncharacterized protein n=1 Tax=Catharanthus roseus TaxID=4058 RepID=A0ACB9ZU90_CATRO|nr:hypothetical protein M9H77_36608 [Catharanthus roseus]